MEYTRILTIAGSDSGGGAGIQADLKTIAACGCYGMSVITAVTAQNTQGVAAIHPVPVQVVEAQLRSVLDDIGADAIKIGMLYSQELIERVAMVLGEYGRPKVVLDPVLIATSGDSLVCGEVAEALKEKLFPLADLVTPNIPEAEKLLGGPMGGDLAEAAGRIAAELSVSVLVKAGHAEGGRLVDVLHEHESGRVTTYENERVATENTHGTGCTLSSAIACFLARGMSLADAVGRAEEYLNGAIRAGALYRTGRGHGPVHHFYHYWS